jgi:hypothetical protein
MIDYGTDAHWAIVSKKGILPYPTIFIVSQIQYTLCSSQQEYGESLKIFSLHVPKKHSWYISFLQRSCVYQPGDIPSLRELLQDLLPRAAG